MAACRLSASNLYDINIVGFLVRVAMSITVICSAGGWLKNLDGREYSKVSLRNQVRVEKLAKKEVKGEFSCQLFE